MIEDGGIICGDDLNLQLNEVDKKIANINKNKDFIQDPNTKKLSPVVTIAVDEFFGKVNSWAVFNTKKSNTWHNISKRYTYNISVNILLKNFYIKPKITTMI